MTAPIPYTKPSITDPEVAYATDAARNGWGTHCYDCIERFESEFAQHIGVEYAIATSSCAGVMHLGLATLGIGPGDEVILAHTNWIATAAPIAHAGACPVVVDIPEGTSCINPDLAEAAITPASKANISMRVSGKVCDMCYLLDVDAGHGIRVTADAAKAIGSPDHGNRAGALRVFGHSRLMERLVAIVLMRRFHREPCRTLREGPHHEQARTCARADQAVVARKP